MTKPITQIAYELLMNYISSPQKRSKQLRQTSILNEEKKIEKTRLLNTRKYIRTV